MGRRLVRVLLLCSLMGAQARAEETLASWAARIDTPDIQRKILNLIFPGQVGPVSSARADPKSGLIYFPKGGFWVRLSQDAVRDTSTAAGHTPFLVVSCMSYQSPEKEPMSAVSYVLHDTMRRPAALSGGYAAHERVQQVTLPKLKKSFLLIVSSSGKGSGKTGQWSAALYLIEPNGMGDRPKPAWTSPMSARTFQLSFDALDGKTERLLLRTDRSGRGEFEHAAYRWEGSRFEKDGFASDSRMKALPEDVWRYGADQ